MSALLQSLVNKPYKHGFVTDIESDVAPKGLNEDTIRLISTKKNEPEWLLEFRLKAYRHWLTMDEPHWAERQISEDRFPGHHLLLGAQAEEEAGQHGRSRSGAAAHVREARRADERARSARRRRGRRDLRLVSVATTYKDKLAKVGIIFCSISEAVQRPSGAGAASTWARVVPTGDNYYAALNSAVFTDGSFVLHPEGREVPDGAVDLLPHQHRGDRASSSAR